MKVSTSLASKQSDAEKLKLLIDSAYEETKIQEAVKTKIDVHTLENEKQLKLKKDDLLVK